MIPKWFIIQPPPDIEVSIDKWTEFAQNRMDLLTSLVNDPNGTVRDFFPRHSEDLDNIYDEGRLGVYLLWLAAVINNKFMAWVIESEGDLFEIFFQTRTTDTEKLAIIKLLFGAENVLELNQFRTKMDERQNQRLIDLQQKFLKTKNDFLICLHFTTVPSFISKHKGYLRKGWVISNINSFTGVIKKTFESRLEQEINQVRDRVGIRDEIDQAINLIINRFTNNIKNRLLQFSGRGGSFELEGSELYKQTIVYPPCMMYLYNTFMVTGRLPHRSRLQLGFFLKKIGMPLKDQEIFWWEHSIDNEGKTLEQFYRTSGYQIRHLYGLEGGKTDYNVPKCQTIASGYFCPFYHFDFKILKEFLLNNPLTKDKEINEKVIDDIVMKSKNNQFQACGMYFTQLFKKRNSAVFHPLSWVRKSSKIKGILPESDENNDKPPDDVLE